MARRVGREVAWLVALLLLFVGTRATQLQATSTEGQLTVRSLRFSGGSLSALRLPQQPASLSELSGAEELEYEQAWDVGSASWELTVAAPAGARRVAVWCRSCAGGAGERVDGLVASTPVQRQQEKHGEQQEEEGGPTVVVLLSGAAMPAAGGSLAHARALRQAAAQTVSIGAQQYGFDNVVDLSQYTGTPFSFYYTLLANGTLRGAIVATTPGAATAHYAGLGFGRRMIGANVFVATPQYADGYVFTSTSTARANAGRGAWKLSDVAFGQNSNSELVGAFTATGMSPGAQPCIFAIGPFSGGKLMDHTGADGNYGNCQLDLVVSPASSASGSGAPGSPTPSASSSGTSPAASASPASPAPESTTAEDEDEGKGKGKASAAASPAPTASAAAAPATAGNASGSASAAGSGGSNAACVSTANGVTSRYSACMLVAGIGQSYYAMWNITPSASNPALSTLTMALNTSDTTGYVAVAWPAQAGTMTGASAMVLSSGGTSGTPSMTQYYLGGTHQRNVNPGGALTVSAPTASVGGGWLTGSFQMQIATPPSAAGGRRLLRRLLAAYLDTPADQNLLWAAGPVASDGSPQEHDSYGDSNVNLLAAASGAGGGLVAGDISTGGSKGDLENAHAWMATIGWGILIPAGVVAARFKAVRPPGWFHAHRALQTLGFVVGAVGVGLGFGASDGWETEYTVHRDLGVTVTVLGVLQLTALAFRPKLDSAARPYWSFAHMWLGRSAVVIAIANIYYGCLHVKELGTWAWATYTGLLAAILAVGLANEAAACASRRAHLGSPGAKAQFVSAADVNLRSAQPARDEGASAPKGAVWLVEGAGSSAART